jgi:hypothetical protein
LLKKFNKSGATAQFPGTLQECSQDKRGVLRVMSRDPTTQLLCPGVNDFCETAEAVVFPTPSSIFATPVLRRSVNLSNFSDQIFSPTCDFGGRDAIWKISPPLNQPGRHFTVTTDGSNFDTILSVFRGTCDAQVPVTCNDNNGLTPYSRVEFTTDGESVYYIVLEGKNGAYGRARITFTSP